MERNQAELATHPVWLFIAWMPAIRGIMPSGDFREWEAIDAWGMSIADALRAARAHA
ncbi:hypothetical protein ACEYYH_11845 [Microbacterium trichothecenolyticum]|uniref:hypothetical protein n=1 Tax=Microbacterium trichothecenolyticum TaxID=69370 RepID=UPI0035BE651D